MRGTVGMTEFYVSPVGDDNLLRLSSSSGFATLDAAIRAMAANAKAMAANAAADAKATAANAAPVTVTDGATVEIDGASAQAATFTGDTDALKLNDEVVFRGQVSGLAESEVRDLADVSYATCAGDLVG